MLDHIYNLPLSRVAAVTAVIFVGVYWAGCFLLRPVLRTFVRSSGRENEIIGNVMSAFGVFYGLLLSLIAVAAYQNVSKVEEHVASEASSMLAIFNDAAQLAPSQAEPIHELLRAYSRRIIEEEWPIQRQGELPIGGSEVSQIRAALLDIETSNRRDELVQDRALEHFESMAESGRFRRYATQMGIPSVMWYVVIVGTLINFGLLWLFEMRLVSQLFLGGLLAFFLGALILLIVVLDRPYRSVQFGVSPAPHELVLRLMSQARSGADAGEETEPTSR